MRIADLHNKAMDAAESADFQRLKGDPDNVATQLLQEAFQYEREAAILARKEQEEPTLSVLHRSAASLALECGKMEEAEKLIAFALSGSPPEIIANELRDLLDNYQTLCLPCHKAKSAKMRTEQARKRAKRRK